MPAVDYEQLASFYDVLVTAGDDVSFFVDLSRQAEGPVIELMAGSGRVSVPVAAAGVDLTCVDSSPAMLEILRRKLMARGLRAKLVQQDVARLELRPCFLLAFLAFHAFEELTEDAERQGLMRGAFRHLLPGGRFVCTLHDPQVRLRDVGPGRDRTWPLAAPEDGRELRLCLSTWFDEGRSLVHGRQRIEDPSTGETLLDLPLRFRLTGSDEFRALAEACGFAVEALHGTYDGEPYAPGRSSSMVWVLVRP